jgi:Rrf2 family protein
MKVTSQEEYGLRCALQLARTGTGRSLTLPEIASREGLTIPHTGKLLALLRLGGVVCSVRGRTGGYSIARPADSISAAEVLRALGSRPWPEGHCNRHRGTLSACVHAPDCSVRSLWGSLDFIVDRLLGSVTLDDLLHGRLPGDERGGDRPELLQIAEATAGKDPS